MVSTFYEHDCELVLIDILKITKVQLELLTDIDTLLNVEKN